MSSGLVARIIAGLVDGVADRWTEIVRVEACLIPSFLGKQTVEFVWIGGAVHVGPKDGMLPG